MLRLISLVSTGALLACSTAYAGQRAFVSSTGNDANTATSCGPATPCRGFTAAMSVVDPGGEIIALDAAGYGAVNIVKSVSIIGNAGVFAGIAVTNGVAIAIAVPGIHVTLRNLNINGVNSGGAQGVILTDGASLTVDACVISGFSGSGITIAAPANVRVVNSMLRNNGLYGLRVGAGATADVSRSTALGNGSAGFFVHAGAADVITTASFTDTVSTQNGYGFMVNSSDPNAVARASITRSTASENEYGVWIDGTTAFATVGSTMATFNSVSGFYNGTGHFSTLGNNHVQHNPTNVDGFLTPLSGV